VTTKPAFQKILKEILHKKRGRKLITKVSAQETMNFMRGTDEHMKIGYEPNMIKAANQQ
jgi:hypothetical protein